MAERSRFSQFFRLVPPIAPRLWRRAPQRSSPSGSGDTFCSTGSAPAAWPRCSARSCRARRASGRRSSSNASSPSNRAPPISSTCSCRRRASARCSATRTSCRSSTSATSAATTSWRWSTCAAATLQALMRKLRRQNLLCPVPVAAFIAHEVAACLGYAHDLVGPDGKRLNIVHRDVSPSNIMCLRTGGVKLLDFGIAKAAGDSTENTEQGLFKGKLALRRAGADQERAARRPRRHLRAGRRAVGDAGRQAAVPRQERARDAEQRPRDAGAAAVDRTARHPGVAGCGRDAARSSATGTSRYPTGQAMAEDLEAVLHLTGFHARMLSDLLREAFGSDLSNSQETLSQRVARDAGRRWRRIPRRGTGERHAAGRREPSRAGNGAAQRGFSVVGAAAVTATLAGCCWRAAGAAARWRTNGHEDVPAASGARAGARRRPCRRCTGGGRAEPAGPEAAAPTPAAAEAAAEDAEVDVEAVAPPPPIVAASRRRKIASRAACRSIRSRKRSGRRSRDDERARDRARWSSAALLSGRGRRQPPAPEAERKRARTSRRARRTSRPARSTKRWRSISRVTTRSRCPGFLVNIAQCQRRLGDLKKARATYQKFVLVAPDSPLVPQVRSMIAEIDGLLEKEPDKPAAEPDADAKPAVAVPGAVRRRRRPAPVLRRRGTRRPPRPPRPSRPATAGGCGARSAPSSWAARSRRSRSRRAAPRQSMTARSPRFVADRGRMRSSSHHVVQRLALACGACSSRQRVAARRRSSSRARCCSTLSVGAGVTTPDELRISVYDDTGALWNDARVPASGRRSSPRARRSSARC